VIPVILDTDLGTDIDDHWAVAMLLGCPELDVRLITTASGDTTYRAQLLAGVLKAAGRTDIPIGIGPATAMLEGVDLHIVPGAAAETPLDSYPGTVLPDGVGAIIDVITRSEAPVTVITIGPITNLAAALDRDPSIVERSRVVSMAAFLRGSQSAGAQPEYNVIADVPAFRRVLESSWDLTLAPIDTCGLIVLDGDRYAPLRDSTSATLETVMRSYREWSEHPSFASPDVSPERQTSVLFDTLAVYLAYDHEHVAVESLDLVIDDAGVVSESPEGRPVHVAITWRDFDGFLDHLVGRLSTV
jgi:inosine-uridine nucleoside N-ribohydrolase